MKTVLTGAGPRYAGGSLRMAMMVGALVGGVAGGLPQPAIVDTRNERSKKQGDSRRDRRMQAAIDKRERKAEKRTAAGRR